MTDAPLLLATTGNFIFRYAATPADRQEMEAAVRLHGPELATWLTAMQAEDLDRLAQETLDALQDAGPLAEKLVDDVDAFVKEAPRQHMDLGGWALAAGGVSALLIAATSVLVLASRIHRLRRDPDGAIEATFFKGVPKEVPKALDQIAGMTRSFDRVIDRLSGPVEDQDD